MELTFTENKEILPGHVIRRYLYPGKIILTYQIPICKCHIPNGIKGMYCSNCKGAILDEKEIQKLTKKSKDEKNRSKS